MKKMMDSEIIQAMTDGRASFLGRPITMDIYEEVCAPEAPGYIRIMTEQADYLRDTASTYAQMQHVLAETRNQESVLAHRAQNAARYCVWHSHVYGELTDEIFYTDFTRLRNLIYKNTLATFIFFTGAAHFPAQKVYDKLAEDGETWADGYFYTWLGKVCHEGYTLANWIDVEQEKADDAEHQKI